MKDDLYLSVLYNGFAQLVERMQRRLNQNQLGPMENLEAAIREMVQFAYQNPHMFELMRTVPWRRVIENAQWDSKRNELRALIESIIRSGIACGDTEVTLTGEKWIGGDLPIPLIGTDSIQTEDCVTESCHP